MIVFDSSAWVEYLMGTDKGLKVKKIIDNNDLIYTPSICLAEIKSFHSKNGIGWKENINFIMMRSKIVPLDTDDSLLSADIKKDFNLHLSDAIIYSTSIILNLPLLTKDSHFKGLRNIIMI
ncbi:MAG: PIN domain-containing protein [Candidatus Woesearchaeota archaeon]